MAPRASSLNPVFAGLGTTIFTVMSALAVEHDAVNLGQGFPDEDGPVAIREAAARALIDGPNQYPPTRGLPRLRQAIADHAKRFYGFDFDPQTRGADHLGRDRSADGLDHGADPAGQRDRADRAGL